ncbi:type VII secretion target [Gordonia sp. (in: high G+C Gram-positive bacteria)]|uniref:type VII secretion target n=1 Tax=Gordonia sp. (in: high G+C Gram-positive bacteria) TaxID=84139 RepID=UPI0039E64204
MTVTLHAPTADRFAADHLATAHEVVGIALSLRGDLARLLPTFGLIGTEFLAVLARVLDEAGRHLDGLATHHGGIADATRSGVDDYSATDESAARRTRGVLL